MTKKPDAMTVLDFWWSAGSEKWYSSDPEFDEQISAQFGSLYDEAAAGKLDAWQNSPHGSLALIILLDQFSRNLFRNSPKAFATDAKALAIAKQAIDNRFDLVFPDEPRQFFYLPFMHSEDIDDQTRCIDIFRKSGREQNYFYALIHMDAIRRFGRFPHRNSVLGRETTEAEQAYLESGGFSG